jgi:tripartite-type tricarboxylate transporter receptor subunit TctC
MSGELFKEMAGVQIRHIPYKGRAQSLPDLLSGRISMLFDNLSSSLVLIKAVKVQALGVGNHHKALSCRPQKSLLWLSRD